MCGRIVQKSGPLDYVERIFPNPRRVLTDPAGPRYNIPPGTRPLTMYRLAGEIYDDLLAGLTVEPRVIERDQMTAELLEEPRKLRKGMRPP